MKRTLSLAFALALAATLSACDRDGANAGSGATSGSSGSSAGSSSSGSAGSSGSMGSGSTSGSTAQKKAPSSPALRLDHRQVSRSRAQRTRVRLSTPEGAKRRTSSALGAGSFSCARSR